MPFVPILRGTAFGGVGFLLGAGLAAGIREWMGIDPWVTEPLVVVVGYIFGLIGWLLGVGLWKRGPVNGSATHLMRLHILAGSVTFATTPTTR